MEANEDGFCNIDISDTRSFTSMKFSKDDHDVVNDIQATCIDHKEGIYIKTIALVVYEIC